MADLSVLLAYVITLGIPMLIIGITSMMDSTKIGITLAYINFIGLCVYYISIGSIASWFLIMALIVISLIFTVLYKGILGSGSSE